MLEIKTNCMKYVHLVITVFFLWPIFLSAQPVMDFPKEIDYGVVLLNSDPNRKFTFYNTGDEPLVILTARASVGSLVPKWPKEPIAPGDSAEFFVRYDTKKRGTFKHKMLFKTNESPDYQYFIVQGDVRRSLDEPSTEAYYMSQGRFKLGIEKSSLGAAADFDRVIEMNPKNVDAYYLRAKAYANLEEWKKAIQDYNTVIEMEPDNWEAYAGRGFTKAVKEIGDTQGAITDLSTAIHLNPENAGLYYSRGLLMGMSTNFQASIDDYNKAIELAPEARFYESRGQARIVLNQKTEACKDFSQAQTMGSKTATEKIQKYCN